MDDEDERDLDRCANSLSVSSVSEGDRWAVRPSIRAKGSVIELEWLFSVAIVGCKVEFVQIVTLSRSLLWFHGRRFGSFSLKNLKECTRKHSRVRRHQHSHIEISFNTK